MKPDLCYLFTAFVVQEQLSLLTSDNCCCFALLMILKLNNSFVADFSENYCKNYIQKSSSQDDCDPENGLYSKITSSNKIFDGKWKKKHLTGKYPWILKSMSSTRVKSYKITNKKAIISESRLGPPSDDALFLMLLPELWRWIKPPW